MAKIIILMLLLSISNHCQANSIAIDAVKADKKIIHYLADKSITNFQITYQQLELGDICGFVGCQWRKLVSVVVTSRSANAPSTTIVALVEGIVPNNQEQPKVTFVTLNNSLPNTLTFIN